MMHMHQEYLSVPCACTTLRKAARAVGKAYDDALAPTGMTTAQFAILRNVSRGDAVPLSRLAENLVMDRSSLYRAIAPIEAKGWVALSAGPGKAKLAALTDAGRTAMAAAEPYWEQAQKHVVGTMADVWIGLEFGLKALTRVAQEAHR
ncbi:MAG: MarR family transcriptional regulator [Sphingomonadales bacterium]|nr:MAG: MarR family transcriptional regulator [Sphingomonadales bacterium]